MMPNITRGDRMAGLVSYLAGPGRANEHEEPHVVAGDSAVMAWHSDTELSAEGAVKLARHLDRPKRDLNVDVKGGHVWHCSLSLRAVEGELSDERWEAIANDFMKLMDFDDAEGTKAPVRWAAIRHGASKAGNDHIHIAVNLVREDGTKLSIHNDRIRAQRAARELENRYELETLESVRAERSTRGYHPAERMAHARLRAHAMYEQERTKAGAGVPWAKLSAEDRNARILAVMTKDQPRYDLARTVRACSTAAVDEAEFVRRMRRSGLLVRPRFAEGTQDVVTGYSVARRPEAGERPIWFGGGRLGRDLTLPRLRADWADTPQGATAAAAEWNAAYRGRRVAAPGREMAESDPAQYDRMNAELTKLRDHLSKVPVDDRETWSRVARHTAGAFAAWSKASEAEPGELAHIADVLSKSAQTWRTPQQAVSRRTRTAFADTAMLLAVAVRGGKGTASQLLMLRQLSKLAQSVFDAARAAGELRQAQAIRDANSEQLRTVHARLKAYAGSEQAAAPTSTLAPELEAIKSRVEAGRTDPGRMGSPLPNQLPEPSRKPSTPNVNHGVER